MILRKNQGRFNMGNELTFSPGIAPTYSKTQRVAVIFGLELFRDSRGKS